MNPRVYVAVIGSGFSGSLLAWILASRGVDVALIDPVLHPRFAIGESSTPIADMLLRRLATEYALPELHTMSSWGLWQQHHSDLAVGRKRGFSYYQHPPQSAYHEAYRGQRSLLVAASRSDDAADTHWYRHDVDAFLFSKAIDAGALDLSGCRVDGRDRRGNQSLLRCSGRRQLTLHTDWVIDASGAAGVMASLCRVANRTAELQTQTHSVFAHYRGVASWTDHLRQHGFDLSGDPFDGDDAAQHHLVGRGWMWMLRMNNGITSVGYTAPTSVSLDHSGHPSLQSLFAGADRIHPQGEPQPTGRLQRWYDPVIDDRTLMLPTAAVTLDPLHSTGIAHGIAGVDRVAAIVLEGTSPRQSERIASYRAAIHAETRLLDTLVSTAYATIQDFPRFTTACMLYFAAAIRCEERYQRGQTPDRLWNADDLPFVKLVDWACERLRNSTGDEADDEIRDRLAPWNTAGLMRADAAGRYAYTATKP